MYALVLCLFTVDIPDDCKVSNKGHYCTWASIETLGRLHKIDKLHGLLEYRRSIRGGYADPGYMNVVKNQLNTLGVQSLVQYDYTYDRELLKKYVPTHGVVVTFFAGNNHCGGCHSVVLIHHDDNIIQFYDTSKPYKIWTASRQWFDMFWSGSAVVVLGE